MSRELEVAGRNGNRESRALLKQSLAARLRDEILQGRIAPGQKIIEGRWERHFGVAQLSIREALNILVAEGFVTKRHGRSARVLNLTETDIIHIYQIRGALEGLAARIIAERKLPLREIESAMDAIQASVVSNDPLEVIHAVQRFHLSVLEKTENPLLLDTGKRLIVPLLAFTRMRVQAKNLDASPWVPEVSNHQRILDALSMGDPHLAEQTVVHITGLGGHCRRLGSCIRSRDNLDRRWSDEKRWCHHPVYRILCAQACVDALGQGSDPCRRTWEQCRPYRSSSALVTRGRSQRINVLRFLSLTLIPTGDLMGP